MTRRPSASRSTPVFDVSGVLRLRIEWGSDDPLQCGEGVIADPTLIY